MMAVAPIGTSGCCELLIFLFGRRKSERFLAKFRVIHKGSKVMDGFVLGKRPEGVLRTLPSLPAD